MVKALIKKNFVILGAQIPPARRLILIVYLIFIVALDFSGEELSGIAFSTPIFTTVFATMPTELEKKSRFPRYLLSAPVTVKDIATANFVFFASSITISTLFSAVITALSLLIHGITPTFGDFKILLMIFGFLMTFFSIYIPVSMKFGDTAASNTASVFFFSLIAFATIYALFGDLEFVASLFDSLTQSTETSDYISLGFAGFSVIAMLVGYFAARRIRYL